MRLTGGKVASGGRCAKLHPAGHLGTGVFIGSVVGLTSGHFGSPATTVLAPGEQHVVSKWGAAGGVCAAGRQKQRGDKQGV